MPTKTLYCAVDDATDLQGSAQSSREKISEKNWAMIYCTCATMLIAGEVSEKVERARIFSQEKIPLIGKSSGSRIW